MTRTLFWIGLALAAVAWLLLAPDSVAPMIQFNAESPWIIGNTEDAFDYAGETVRITEGIAKLVIEPETGNGTLEVRMMPDPSLAAILSGASPKHDIVLQLDLRHANELWTTSDFVHGDSEIGETRLPGTHALFAGSGDFELLIDGTSQPTSWRGLWSVADALRRADGSIRDQGLVFSPLLRDRSGFSDPERSELTLLIYGDSDTDDVVLHLVFPISAKHPNNDA